MMQTSKAEGMLEDGGSDLVGGSAGNGSLEQMVNATTEEAPSSSSSALDMAALVRFSKFYVEGVGILSIGLVGLFINVLALSILFRKQVMRNFHLLMCSLAVYDLLHLVLDVVCFALPEFSRDYRDRVLLHGIPYLIPITQITLTGSCYTTIAITIERFLAIRHPFLIQRHNIKARMFVVPVLIYAVLYNIPRFFEFKVVPRCEWGEDVGEDSAANNSAILVYDGGNVSSSSSSSAALPPCDDEGYLGPEYGLAVTETRMNKAYILVYVNTMNLLFNMVLPFATMLSMNCLIYRAMNRPQRSRNRFSRSGNGGGSAANGHHGARSTSMPAAAQPQALRFYRSRRLTALRRNGEGVNGAVGGGGGAEANNNHNLRRSCENVLRRREARITRASIAITVMFVVCHLPRCVPNLMEMVMERKDFPRWLPILVSVNHLLIAVNSAFNFLFYLSYCWGRKRMGRGGSSILGGLLGGRGVSRGSGEGGRGGRGGGGSATTNTGTDLWVDDLNCTTELNGVLVGAAGGGVNSVRGPGSNGRLANSLVVTYRSGVSQTSEDPLSSSCLDDASAAAGGGGTGRSDGAPERGAAASGIILSPTSIEKKVQFASSVITAPKQIPALTSGFVGSSQQQQQQQQQQAQAASARLFSSSASSSSGNSPKNGSSALASAGAKIENGGTSSKSGKRGSGGGGGLLSLLPAPIRPGGRRRRGRTQRMDSDEFFGTVGSSVSTGNLDKEETEPLNRVEREIASK